MSYNNHIIFPEDGGPIDDQDHHIQFYQQSSRKDESMDEQVSDESYNDKVERVDKTDILVEELPTGDVPTTIVHNDVLK